MHDLYRLKETLVKELEEQGKTGEMSKSSLETIDKLAHAAKNVAKVIECCEEEEYSMAMDGYSREDGYSRRTAYPTGSRSYMNDGSGNFVRPDGSYRDTGMSFARGRGRNARRDSMGRYSRAEDEIQEGLMKLMDKAPDEQTRSEIRRLMENM